MSLFLVLYKKNVEYMDNKESKSLKSIDSV